MHGGVCGGVDLGRGSVWWCNGVCDSVDMGHGGQERHGCICGSADLGCRGVAMQWLMEVWQGDGSWRRVGPRWVVHGVCVVVHSVRDESWTLNIYRN